MIKNKDKTPLKIDLNTSTKKVYFGDDGGVVDKPKKVEKEEKSEVSNGHGAAGSKNKQFGKKSTDESKEIEKKWYQKFDAFNTGEVKELSDFENKTLTQICRNAFSELIVKLEKSEEIRY